MTPHPAGSSAAGVRVTYVGGPTALIEIDGVRLLTDPTFDPGGTDYPTPVYTLRKTVGPALDAASLGPVDVVLLSHDHHFDNLDRAGRALLAAVPRVITTRAGAERLGGNAIGLSAWESMELTPSLRVTATPARHGPADGDRGPVVGFLLERAASPERSVYVTGDTVWYEGVAEVARRAHVAAVLAFVGAARVREVGTAHLTLTAGEAVEVARAFPRAAIVPLHFEGWEHFSEGRDELTRAFAAARLADRLCWLEPGRATTVAP